MRKKFWKILGTTLALLLVLLLLFVVAFIFNPFEASLADIRELVPADPDWFVRKVDLKEDFADFPEPHFWAELEGSPAWQTLRGGAAVQDLARDVESAVAELRRVSDELSRQTGGIASLLGDVIGEEVVLAGKFVPPSLDASAFCAYLRVGWKVRFAWGLLEWESVRAKIAEAGTRIDRRDDGTMVVGPDSPQPLYLARFADCLMAANDEEFLERSLAHAAGADDSFAAMPQYRDGIVGAIDEWESSTGVAANALELYLRPDQLFELTRWDDGWPDPRAPEDMNQRVLASFLNLSGWRFLSGALIFEPQPGPTDPESLTLLARVELNENMHTGFQREFFRAEPQDRSEWLTPFLTMVPEKACAAAALRMPAGDFLQEMFQAVEPELRREIDQLVGRTGKFQNVAQIIDSIRPALLPRTGFVFHRKREIGGGIETFEPSPAPHVAWVFWIDPRLRQPIDDLYTFITQSSSTLGFDKAYDLAIRGGGGGDAAREFVNANIPGTGEIALMLYGNFFVVSNSGPLIRDMVLSRLEGRNVLGVQEYQTFERELSNKLSAFVFVQGERMAEVVQDYLDFVDAGSSAPDVGWAVGIRPQVEREVLRREFPRARAVGSLQGAERERFEELVGREIERLWSRDRSGYMQGARERYEQLRALMDTFSAAYLQIDFESRKFDLQSRVLIDYR